ncbi:MAG: hypothetical protein QM598_05760 [Protaetiibacter sp.]
MNRTIAIAIIAMTAALLAGCTTPEPTPTPSHSASETPSPTPTVGDVAPAQDPVPAPASEDEAKIAAEKTINLYLGYLFEFQREPELGADYMRNYVADHAMERLIDTARENLARGMRASGGPIKFSADYALSYAGQITDTATGTVYPNSVVYMIGCGDNSAQMISTNGGEPTPISDTPTFPIQYVVRYTPELEVWLVIDSQSLRGQSGAPQC